MNLDRRVTRSTTRPQILLLRGRPQAVADARHFVRGYLGTAAHAVTRDHLDDVVLVVSELVTNAVRHVSAPAGSLRFVVDADDRRTRVEVHDTGRSHPHMRTATAESDGGRGLAIVAALCPDAWGVTDTETGKAVWAEVPA